MMRRLAVLLVVAGVLLVSADTLTLRSGATVKGSFVGIDAAQITFLVEGKLQSFARGDVLGVTFGEEAAAPPPIPPPPPLPIPPPLPVAAASNEAAALDPPEVGRLYLYDEAAHKLGGLEHARFNAADLYLSRFELKGTASSVRVPAGQTATFAMKMKEVKKPPQLWVVAMQITKKDTRLLHLARKKDSEFIELNARRSGDCCYLYTPASALSPGEYAVVTKESLLVGFFGLDGGK